MSRPEHIAPPEEVLLLLQLLPLHPSGLFICYRVRAVFKGCCRQMRRSANAYQATLALHSKAWRVRALHVYVQVLQCG